MMCIPSILFTISPRPLFFSPSSKPWLLRSTVRNCTIRYYSTLQYMLNFWLSPSDSDYLSTWLTVFIECNIDIQAENPSNTLASVSSPLPSDKFQILILGFLPYEHHRPSLQLVHSTTTCSNNSLMSVVLVIYCLCYFFPYC